MRKFMKRQHGLADCFLSVGRVDVYKRQLIGSGSTKTYAGAIEADATLRVTFSDPQPEVCLLYTSECSLPPRAKLLPPPVGASPAVERQTSHCRTASFPAVGQRTSFVVGRQTFLTVGRQIPLAGGKRASPAVARGRRCFLRLLGRRCTDLPVCEWLCKPLISEAFRLTVWPAFPKRGLDVYKRQLYRVRGRKAAFALRRRTIQCRLHGQIY